MRSTKYRDVKVEDRTSNGYVVAIETGSRAYFVPLEDRSAAIEAARAADVAPRSEWGDDESIPSETVEFGRSTGRDYAERALLWSCCQDRAGSDYEDLPLSYPDDMIASKPSEERVPVPIALEGKEILSGYLSALGHSDSRIAHALDVSEATVRQYLSNVRNGGRS